MNVVPIPSTHSPSIHRSTRRRFAFWVGLGLFGLSERLRADSLDGLAAAMMRGASGSDLDAPATGLDEQQDRISTADPVREPETPEVAGEHWTFEENDRWYWFQRETLIAGVWQLSGRTRPIHKHSGRRGPEQEGYLADSAVPLRVRRPRPDPDPEPQPVVQDAHNRADQPPLPSEWAEFTESNDLDSSSPLAEAGQPSHERRFRHGRPPSRWLRSLNAEELRIWLRTIEVPEAGVSGMTFWVHLTRDHRFDPDRIAGLTTEEQAKLHAAAHDGY